MKKQDIATFVSFLAILALTLIPILVPSEQLPSWKWRGPVIFAGAVAVVAGFLQIQWTKMDEAEERKKMYALLHRILTTIQQRRRKHGGLAFEAADAATNLVNHLVTHPATTRFHPDFNRTLFDCLSRARNIGQTAFAQAERPVSKDSVLNEVERLASLAIQHLDENK